MDFKIYVVNLASYNEGDTRGDWFTLPVDIEEVFEKIFTKDELDDQGNPHGDWAIHDYDFPIPFDVHEYTPISKLNDIVETYESLTSFSLQNEIEAENHDVTVLINLASSLKTEDAINDIVHLDQLIGVLKDELDQGNIYTVKNMLQDVTYSSLDNDEYFIEEGDGNYRSINDEDRSDKLKEIIKQFQEQF